MNKRIALAMAGLGAGTSTVVHHVKVTTGIAALAILLVTSANAQAASYYVSTTGSDANPGTISQPFRTVKRGVRSLQPGDVLFIRGGVYTEHVVENDFGASGSSSAWISVSGYQGESVTIRNAGASEILRFQDGSKHHIEVKDLTLDGGSYDDGHGIVIIGYPGCCGDGTATHDLKFSNVEIKNTWSNGIIGGGSNHQFINLRLHGNGRVPPETYTPGANAVYFTGDNSVFVGGEYFDNLCWGIRIADSETGHRATGNVITRVKVYNNGAGKGLGGASRCGASGGGIVIGDTNNTVMNSVLYNNLTGIDIAGLSGKTVQGIQIYNNTIYGNTGHAIGVGMFAGAANTSITNNILRLNGSAVTEFAALNTVESYNLTLDPTFVDPSRGDFSLRSGSPAIDRGIALQNVIEDFDGDARPKGQGADIGAFEFGAAGAPALAPPPPPPPGTVPAPPRNVRLLGQ